MAVTKDSIFNKMLNIHHPWTLNLISCSKHQQEIYLLIDYDSQEMRCPICGKISSVVSKIPATWQYLDCFQFKSFITAFLPLLARKCCCDQAVLNDIILLNLIISQVKNSDVLSPLTVLNL